MSENKSNSIETPKVKKKPVFSGRVNLLIIAITILRVAWSVLEYTSWGTYYDPGVGSTAFGALIGAYITTWIIAFVLMKSYEYVMVKRRK